MYDAPNCGGQCTLDRGSTMPASKRRRAATPKQVAHSPAAAAPMENRVKQELTVGVKRRLGLGENERVPAEIQGVVDSAAREVVGNSVASAVVREVSKLRPSSLSGTSGSEATPLSSDVALLREAEHLAAKKNALLVAGFSNDEAMRILVAEVAGRASQIES